LVQVWWGRCAGDSRREARALLIEAAAAALDIPAQAVEVSYEPGGRPCLLGVGAGLHVGVSHCRAGAIAVVTSTVAPVGVDVEVIRPVPWQQMAGRHMAADEVDWLADLPAGEQVAAFFRLWTYKESVGKAYGVGLRGGGLRRIGGSAAPAGNPALDGPWTLSATPDDSAMVAAVARPAPDVMLAVACHDGRANGSAAAIDYAGRR
jgi:4'-phosphopantetheinyl transferase